VVAVLSEGLAKPKLTDQVGGVSSGGSYPDNSVCSWWIEVPGAKSITLTFSQFDFEESYDFVYVLTGSPEDDTSQKIAELTGSKVPQPITVEGSSLFILLRSDGSSHASGFQGVYRSDNAPAGAAPVISPVSNVCSPWNTKEYISPACKFCVLATVSSVCGQRCLKDQLHIMPVARLTLPPPSMCVRDLGHMLGVEQMGRFERALGQNQPLGLVFGELSTSHPELMTDLYMPTRSGTSLFGKRIYLGIDTGYALFPCDPALHARVWAISTSADQEQWRRCEGSAWVDAVTGQARSAIDHKESAVLPVFVGDWFAQCVVPLGTTQPMANGRMVFGPEITPEAVACWLARFFGPQVATTTMKPPGVIELSPMREFVHLTSDLVVRSGQRLTLIGHGNTLRVGNMQVRVEAGEELVLDRVTIAESAHSPGIVSEGSVNVINSIVRDCTAVMSSIDVDGLHSRGGGFYIANGSTLTLADSELVRNSAEEGGGIFCDGRIECADLAR
jgi:hypothetical protein